jgi:15-cis-phytoene synthase
MSDNPERGLVLAYSPGEAAARALAALLALDDRLSQTVRSGGEPMLGQIRMKWWHDALAALDAAPAPGEPVLEGIARDVLPRGVRGAEVAAIAEAWGEIIGGELDSDALERFSVRGRVLFELAGRVAGASSHDRLGRAGEGWALGDLARGLSDAGEAQAARSRAQAALDEALRMQWSRNGRAMGAMAHLARLDLAGSAIGSPRRVARLLWHRLTGR